MLFFSSLKTLPVVAIYKAGTGAFIQHHAVGWAAEEDANWVAKFLKPIPGQIPCSVFCRHYGLPLWEFTQIRGNGHQLWFFFFGSPRLFFAHVLRFAPLVSVLMTLYGEHDTAKTQRCRGGSLCLIHLLSLFEGRADCMCCLKGYRWLFMTMVRSIGNHKDK